MKIIKSMSAKKQVSASPNWTPSEKELKTITDTLNSIVSKHTELVKTVLAKTQSKLLKQLATNTSSNKKLLKEIIMDIDLNEGEKLSRDVILTAIYNNVGRRSHLLQDVLDELRKYF